MIYRACSPDVVAQQPLSGLHEGILLHRDHNLGGDLSRINGIAYGVWGIVHPDLYGDVSGLSGCITGIAGDATGLVGNVERLLASAAA